MTHEDLVRRALEPLPAEELIRLEQKRAAVDAAFRALDLARANLATSTPWLVSAIDFLFAAEGELDADERAIKLKVARAEVERELSRTRVKVAAVEAADAAVSAALGGT
jgi:hypothetical protein